MTTISFERYDDCVVLILDFHLKKHYYVVDLHEVDKVNVFLDYLTGY
jgi:hypothetical protein